MEITEASQTDNVGPIAVQSVIVLSSGMQYSTQKNQKGEMWSVSLVASWCG